MEQIKPTADVSKRAKKTPRHADLRQLGFSGYGDRERNDAKFLASMAPSHPRQFWSAAKRILTDHIRNNDWEILRAFRGHEPLLRAGLMLASRQSRVDGVGHNHALQAMLEGCLTLPGKTDDFQRARTATAAAALSRVSASDVFSVMLAPAAAGHGSAVLALAKLMPDAASADREESRRHTYGQTHFSHQGLHDRSAMATAIAVIDGQAQGLSPAIPSPREICRNAFFWIAHRHLKAQSLADASEEAKAWTQAGVLLVQRCPCITESEQSLALVLGIEPFRKALMERSPKLGAGSHYAFRRESSLGQALQMADSGEVAEIIAYCDASSAARLQELPKDAPIGSPKSYSSLPSWAFALLAGHAPDASWMPAPGSEEAIAIFKIPKAMVDQAKDGMMNFEDHDLRRPAAASYDAARLCKGLGHAWDAPKPPAPKKTKLKA